MRQKTALLLLALVMAGSAVTAALSDTIAARYRVVPAKVSFGSERQHLEDVRVALIHKVFESLSQRPAPEPTLEGGRYLPPPTPPDVRVGGMDSEDLADAQADLARREIIAKYDRSAALSARSQLAQDILTAAMVAFWLALMAGVLVSVAAPFRRWHTRRAAQKRQRPGTPGLHVAAEKAGVMWGLLERVTAPLWHAFDRGRSKARGRDLDAP